MNVVADKWYLDSTVGSTRADLLSGYSFSKNGLCHAIERWHDFLTNNKSYFYHTYNMAIALSSNKPSPDARLARKREAARMRQQRCRARKRQAMLTKRRQQDGRVTQVPYSQEDTKAANPERTKPSPFRDAVLTSSPARDPIFKIVSFDSPRSPENNQSVFVTPDRATTQVISRSCSVESSLCSEPSQKNEAIKIEQSEPDESLVKEEEAAVAAMLSLKSSASSRVSPPASPQETTEDSRPAPVKTPTRDPKYAYYGEWERYHHPYGYGRYAHYPPMPYYAIPPRVTASQYRYPAYGKGYARYG
jgi:hypothetical protein